MRAILIISVVLFSVAIAKKGKDRDSEDDSSSSQYNYNGVSADQARQFSDENRRAYEAWQRENGDMVREHERVARERAATAIDASSLAPALQEYGVVKKDDRAAEIVNQVNINNARRVGNDVYEQEIDGRVIRYRRGAAAPSVPVEDVCQTHPEQCQRSLGIPRYAMPQFKEEGALDNFLKAAKKQGYKVDRRKVRLGDLGVTQGQVLDSKVDRMEEGFRGKDAKKKFDEVNLPTIGNRVLDGHHHFQAALRVYGPDKKVETTRIYKRDKRGREVQLSDDESRRLVAMSLRTKGVSTEDLGDASAPRAELISAFRRFGKQRTRKGERGYDARREYVMRLWAERKARRAAAAGGQARGGRGRGGRSAASATSGGGSSSGRASRRSASYEGRRRY